MKITDVTVTLFQWDDIPATSYNRHTGIFGGSSEMGLVTIHTDEGLEGHAFLGSALDGAHADGPDFIRHLKPLLMDRNPLDRERLYDDLCHRNRAVAWRAIGAADIALWDLAGKAAGLPVHQLIGTYRHSVPAYASSALLPSKEAYAEEAVRIKEAGWAAYKIHPPTRWAEDIEVCRAVRQAVGDDYRVMLDSTWSYSFQHAIRVGRAIEELGFYWYEDPLADDDIYNCVKLREKLNIPLMATEYSPGGFTAYVPWIMMRATDYLRGDVAVKGGITGILKTAHLAEAFGMNYEVHHGGNSHNNWANLHVIAAIPNTEFFEVLLPADAQKYGLVEDLSPDSEGLVYPPSRPGIGAEIDFDLIERKQTAILS
ncbi:MAG: mandelate racemase [Rhodospirillales bacterium]|nr:mandelate racemase [Rhodospirillales bacterium]MCY3856143.1 mandelate racemase [Rhodospirillales bacterium]MDE0373536.1 mandelate racemase [Rhodospirillales bacterium]MXX23626.1 mandelate racemase [Rhodospirillales bacterium]MYE20588.1 mandelate racemase [Rhodospirillales bacterium]